MWLQIIFGIASGIITGLLPGIHVNTVVAILLARSIDDPVAASAYILSLAITHSIVEFVPTAFLGIPDATTAEAQLPAHQLAQEGRSFEALSISAIASGFGGLACVLIAPLAPFILSFLASVFSTHVTVVVLCLFIVIPIVRSRRMSVVFATVAAISLGFVSLGSDFLLPLLSGLFGIPHLIESLTSKAKAPQIRSVRIVKPDAAPLFASLPIGVLFSFLPGAGASTASYFVSRYLPAVASTPERIIALNSSLSTVNYAASIYTLAYLDRARNGAVVGIRELGSPLSLDSSLLIVAVVLIAAPLIALRLAKFLIVVLPRVRYELVTIAVLVLVIAAVVWLSGVLGLLFCAVCTIIGYYSLKREVPKVSLLSCLTGPTIWLIA